MTRQRYLLDTCICVYWLRDKYDVKYRVNDIGMENCNISEITVAELKFGKIYGQLKGGPKFRDQRLDQFLSNINTLPIAPVFDLYAEEKARLTLAGTPAAEFDLLIGCTSVFADMVMVTQNVKDFANIKNIRLENWIPDSKLI